MVPSPPSNRRRKSVAGASNARAQTSPQRRPQASRGSAGEGDGPWNVGTVNNARNNTPPQFALENGGNDTFDATGEDAEGQSGNGNKDMAKENFRRREADGSSEELEGAMALASASIDHSFESEPPSDFFARDMESNVDLLPGAMGRLMAASAEQIEQLVMGRGESLDEEGKAEDEDHLDLDMEEFLVKRDKRPSRCSLEIDEVEGSILAMAKSGSTSRAPIEVNDANVSGLKNQPGPSVAQGAASGHPHNAAAVARSRAVAGQQQAYVQQLQLQQLVPPPPLGWQATKHTLKDRFSFLFNNEVLADVHFVVGRGEQRQRVPAHKFLLSVGSAVFDAMFNGVMAAEAQGQNNEIELPDVEPAAFLALLKFLYSDEVQIGPESVMTTLYTAKKYAVPALENACVDFLKHNLNADNAFMLLTQARLFDEPQLAALCLEMIDKHTAEALSAEGFTDIDLETLCAVLERDTLRIREAVLYQAVVRWSAEECHRQQLPVTPEHQRQALGRALALIRFPLMTVEEFAQSAAQSGILTDRELVTLFLYFTVNPKPAVAFLDVPRCCVTGKEQVVNRFQRIEGRWGYSGTPDRIKFTVDRRIFVVGFGLYGSIHGPTEYQVTIQIIHCGTGKVLGSNDTSFPCDGSSSTFRVLFKEPVEISPCVTYIASACLKGPDSHYGTKGLRRIVHQSPSSGCVTFQFTYAAGNNNGTSVEDGQIPEIIFYTKLT